jgi:hypothetical protein
MQRTAGVDEGGDETVAGVRDFNAAVPAQAIPDERVVGHDEVAAELIAKLVQQCGGSNKIAYE